MQCLHEHHQDFLAPDSERAKQHRVMERWRAATASRSAPTLPPLPELTLAGVFWCEYTCWSGGSFWLISDILVDEWLVASLQPIADQALLCGSEVRTAIFIIGVVCFSLLQPETGCIGFNSVACDTVPLKHISPGPLCKRSLIVKA